MTGLLRGSHAALAGFTLGSSLLGMAAAPNAPAIAAAPTTSAAATPAAAYSAVVPGGRLSFPEDFGSHPSYRTEWWYITGWLTTVSGQPLGFQITFFRTKPTLDETNPSAFAARQLLIAHCAVSDPAQGRLWHDQQIRRAGLDLAGAETGDTHVWIGRWALRREGDARGSSGSYMADLGSEELSLHLRLAVTQAPLINGDSGFSRKGPAPESASYYYSVPHLKVTGTVSRGGGSAQTVGGEGWLDHEWSSEYLDSEAAGWDWVGINLDDGAALMAFRIRNAGGVTRWAGGTLRDAAGRIQVFSPADIHFTPARTWKSPRTGTAYPVAWQLRAGTAELELEPLMDDQENDTRLSTGAIYWEGAIRAYQSGRLAGRGYLELTGYGERLRLH